MAEKPVVIPAGSVLAADVPAAAKADVHPHDLAVMIRLERVNAPKQARSEKRLQEIIRALESLLDGRSFDEITIPDIAERAGCGTASIYARFKSKRSILVALHESVRDRQIRGIDERMSIERHRGLSFEESALSVCRDLVEYFSRHSDFLRAAHLLGDREVYERHLSVIRHASERISAVLIDKVTVEGEARQRLMRRLDMATRAVFALLQQRVTFGDYPPGDFAPGNEDEEAAELAALYGLCLQGIGRQA
ncbi:MAG: TetR/AcrR family transcriptional regulator [Pseudomonadales bacterium]